MQRTGIHRLTAVSADAHGNHAFDTRTLGLRLVKKTVNQDDVSAYHLFYADGRASPGTDLTSFDGRCRASRTSSRPTRARAKFHHVAFRTPDDTGYRGWAERLRAMRIPSSGSVDRRYFRSLHFREPNGILFEIASDGAGFAADEPPDSLGERLALPSFLEPRRAAIEANLKPLAIS